MMRVTFIVVALNAEACLPALLSDLTAQTFPREQLEVLLVDSASADGTRRIMEEYRDSAPFAVRVLENPKGWLACGNNIALRAASGDAVVRLDAHARIPPDFLQKSADALGQGEDIVGGSVLSGPPVSPWGAVMRALDESRFCGGAAPFRNGGEARYVDTLAYAMYRKTVFDRGGPYDERLRRTEDNEMHYRMRRAGFRFRFCPEITSTHAARDTLRGHIRQKWGNGYWIGKTLRIEPRCFAPRHLAPALFVLALLCGLLLLPFSPLPLLLLSALYFTFDLAAAAAAASRARGNRLLTFVCLLFLFPLLHILYGAGTLCGLLSPVRSAETEAVHG